MSFDPGGTTGWALGEYSDAQPYVVLSCGQVPGDVEGFVAWVRENADWIQRVDIIVSESFTLRPGVKSPNLAPVRIEGAMAALFGAGQVVYQPPAFKSLAGDQTLRRGGLWQTGHRHANDAIIHGLVYTKLQRHEPTLRKYWPEAE